MNKTKVAGICLIFLALALLLNKFAPPVPPPGPGPDPGPVPVPVPVVTAPFKTDKLAVLVLEETSQRGKYTTGQLAVFLQPASMAGSLAFEVAFRGGEFYKFDVENGDLSRMPAWVQEAYKLEHPTLPWIVAAGPKSGFSQKLPEVLDETKKLLDGAQ